MLAASRLYINLDYEAAERYSGGRLRMPFG